MMSGKLKFKIDENLPAEFAKILIAEGYEADTVYDEGINGEADAEIIKVCKKENRILITLDLDFSNIVNYPPDKHNGIIVMRLPAQDKLSMITALKNILPVISSKSVHKALWIVGQDRVRIRDQQFFIQ